MSSRTVPAQYWLTRTPAIRIRPWPGSKTNTLYRMTFQSPTGAWEQGKYVIGHFKLDDDQLAELLLSRQA